jgi:hypothetical protein
MVGRMPAIFAELGRPLTTSGPIECDLEPRSNPVAPTTKILERETQLRIYPTCCSPRQLGREL